MITGAKVTALQVRTGVKREEIKSNSLRIRVRQVLLTTTVENYVPGKISVVSARIIPE